MNPTIKKFGYPASLVREYDHWVLLVRPAQVTLGSLVLASKSDATAFGELPPDAFAELGRLVAKVEPALARFTAYERLNYLMLMMIDPQVHFHVIPRYPEERQWSEERFADAGWPGPPALGSAFTLDDRQQSEMAAALRQLL